MEKPDVNCPVTGEPCLGRQKVAELLDERAQRADAIKHALTTACVGSTCPPYRAAALQHKFDSPAASEMRPPLE